jgi:hypothetical protein
MPEIPIARRLGDREDEKGDGDCEDTIAEGLEPALAHRPSASHDSTAV